MDRYICIHGHFYQPPRENPWLEAIELQDSAYPYHNWNERITAECYAPNSVSRILDDNNQIVKLVNNYAKISFNFGPTLLSWLEAKAPDVYAAILEADRESQKHFSGHGSAIAQVYNHIIMPLATRRDRYTQSSGACAISSTASSASPRACGCRKPPSISKVSKSSLDLGIRFTILAPHQAARARRIGTQPWHDVSGGQIDPTRPYLQRLPSGRSIAIFFYDGPISRAVAFEGILARGEQFADRLLGAFSPSARRAAAGAYRHRRRKLWSPSPFRRHGACLRAPLYRVEPACTADQLRRVSGAVSAATRSRDPRKNFLELRPRHRPLVERLRLQLRRPFGLESRVAQAAARCPRRFARVDGRALRREGK